MGQNEVEYDDITGDAQLDGEWEGPTANVSAIDLIYEANENRGHKDLLISKFNKYSNDI